MPYATPAAYIAAFGLDETVQTLADEEGLLTAALMKDALAGAWTGAPSQAEQEAATAALARLVRKLQTQSNLMDGYLGAALTLPLPAEDANAGTLEECCLALTRCALNDDSDNATERADECCKTWRAWLRDVATGKAKLAGASGALVAAATGPRTGQAVSRYDWGRFGGGGWR